jgi:putative component of membrane protein insertase Oxa1/YidC/SpoIIIJ protein YidD
VPKQCPTPILGTVAETLIDFHQTIISPADGPRSHFLPSSSQYTLEAMRTYGFYQGFLMGCDRLMRENSDPWVYKTKVDPASGKTMKIDLVP